MVAVANTAQRIHRSIAFRVTRKARYVAWWLRWGWRPYGEYHRYAMDRLAGIDPRQAVGGMWDYLGSVQFEVLKAFGLRPEHTVLDIGCGSLRGGRHIIKYLDEGNYWGLDISPVLLGAAQQLIKNEGLSDRRPSLSLTHGFGFKEVEGLQFDFVHAFAVLTDVPIEYVDECFANLGKVLGPKGTFLATYIPGERYAPDHVGIGFQYSLQTLQQIGAKHGYSVSPVPNFAHPRGHQMIVTRCSVDSSSITTEAHRHGGMANLGPVGRSML